MLLGKVYGWFSRVMQFRTRFVFLFPNSAPLLLPGVIPIGIGKLVRLETLYLRDTKLSGTCGGSRGGFRCF